MAQIYGNNNNSSNINKNPNTLVDDIDDTNEKGNSRFITKFEMATLLGSRAIDIGLGKEIHVDLGTKEMTPLQIATEELKQRRIPLLLLRRMPDGQIKKRNPNKMDFTLYEDD